MLTRVAQIVTLHIETSNLAGTDLVMIPDRTPNIYISLTYFTGEKLPLKKVGNL